MNVTLIVLSKCTFLYAQDFKINLPPTHPRAAWSVLLYPDGELEMPEELEVYGVTFELEGQLHRVRDVIVGNEGVFVIR